MSLDVFPFVADRVIALDLDHESYISVPYSGDPKGRTVGNTQRAYNAVYSNRTQAEYDAAEAFWISHYPLTHFVFTNYRFYPARTFEVVFVPGTTFREQGSQVSLRFTYSFSITEP